MRPSKKSGDRDRLVATLIGGVYAVRPGATSAKPFFDPSGKVGQDEKSSYKVGKSD